ncbi:hypothetical protein FA13DRAFT_1811043 [Coprinellus micaceus]|uniref:DUF6533 domain-containing protein n=1 Tax=Coprinellus micaceus TaxID=71717 RepID=A0A4Y7TMY1_COPMI|nr:hypothetical protein FA13DRAFT_1811043 [Coprinellus micaceus]
MSGNVTLPDPIAVTSINGLLARGYSGVASLALVSFDHAITAQDEVELVWSRGWGFGTLLFALNRYLPYTDLVVNRLLFRLPLDPKRCRQMDGFVTWMTLLGIALSEGILVLRTMALWNNSRPILYLLGFSFFCLLVVSIIVINLFNKSLVYGPFFDNVGCKVIESNNLVIISFILLVLLETLIVVLTAIRASYHLRRGSSGWVARLYKQGFAFYLYMLTMTLINLIWPIVAQAHYKTLFAGPQRALHSVFCSRVFFIIFRKQIGSSHQTDAYSDSYDRRDSIGGFTKSNNFFSTIVDSMHLPDDPDEIDSASRYDEHTSSDPNERLERGRSHRQGRRNDELDVEIVHRRSQQDTGRRKSWRQSIQSMLSGRESPADGETVEVHMVSMTNPSGNTERTATTDSLDDVK